MADWENKCNSKVQIWWPNKWDARLEELRGDNRRSTFARELLIEAVQRRLEKNNGLTMDMWRTGPPPATGQKQRYPSRFWFNFKREYPIDGLKVLHMFSGSMDWGVTTDIRPETGADIIAPYDNLPIKDGSFDMVIADPSYNKGFASEWTTHSKDLPKPKRILLEAARVTKEGGIIAILHIIVIPQYKEAGVKCIGRHGILCGPNNAIRILNVFRKGAER